MNPTNQKTKRSKAIALTGINSFLGAKLLQVLDNDPKIEHIVAIDINKPPFKTNKTKLYKVDLTSPTSDFELAEILKRENCETLVHMAFFANPPRNRSYAHELHSIGTMYVLNACAEAKIHKIIVKSTTTVYGALPSNPNFLVEDSRLGGGSRLPHIKDRVEVELGVRAFRKRHPNIVVAVLRPCTIMGPTAKGFETQFFKRHLVLTLLGFDPLIQFIHENDVIRAFKIAIEKDFSGEYNIVGEGLMPLSNALKVAGRINIPLSACLYYPLAQALWTANLAPAPSAHLDYIRYLCIADGEKAKRELGFIPQYSTRESLMSFIGTQRLRDVHLIEE